MNPELFDTEYRKTLDAFLDKHKKSLYETDSGWLVYARGDAWVGVCKSPRYELPMEIVELVQVGQISKKNSYPLHFGISFASVVMPDEIFAVNHICFNHFVCHGCNRKIQNSIELWNMDDMCLLCTTCYPNNIHCSDTFCRVYEEHKQRNYKHCSIYRFNAFDWVKFMWDEWAKFYVNCNPQSLEFGNVSMLSNTDDFGMFELVGDINATLEYIQEWARYTVNVDPPTDVQEYLNSEYRIEWNMSYILDIYNFTTDFETVTPQILLDNQHRFTSGSHKKYVIDDINETLTNITLGVCHTNNTFSTWLGNEKLP